jgi:peptidoglycan hydrolase-like protein with peptidoglycan-binding domain
MEKGMRATCIKHLQARLIELNYLPSDSVADGIFGGQTEEAVKHFQSVHGLEATGNADIDMQAILFSDSARPASF